MHRLTDPGARAPERLDEDQRGQAAEVGAGAGHALVEALVRVALAGPVAAVGHGDRAVDDLPAVESLSEGVPHGVLDGLEERVRHGPELHLQAEVDPRAGRRGVDAQADGGEEGVGVLLDELGRRPRPRRPLHAQRRGLAEGHVEPELVGEGGLDDLLLHLAVQRHGGLPPYLVVAQADQRVLLGEPGEGQVEGPAVRSRPRDDHGLQGRRREELPVRLAEFTEGVADPDVGEAPHLGDPAGGHGVPADVGAVVEDADRGDPALLAEVPEGDVGAGAEGSGEDPRVRDLLPRRTPLDLEDGARERTVGVPVGGGQQFLDPVDQLVDARARDGGAEVHRMDHGLPGSVDEGGTEPGAGEGALDISAEQVVVLLGEDVERGRTEAGDEVRAGGAEPGGSAHRHRGGREPFDDRPQHTVTVRAPPVDLVDEDQRGDAQPSQGPHQDAGLRLDPLDGRDHEHGAVEDAEHPLHLGDEVGVARSVDEVDRHVVDRERHDGGLDGDAAPALQREGVGLRVPVVDAADLVDHTDRVQQPLGQAGLTCVDVRENSEVEQVHEASCPLE